jgi:rfaE bifunctional protein nucleotidyltransferase chain/domain
MTAPGKKVVSLAEAAAKCFEARERGERVALCNGVFDLLHVGHVRYLAAARALADVLVVAVNSDRSTLSNRGPGHPMVPEAERAEVLAALASVDWVLIFDQPEASGVIRALRPDLHVKGTDYRAEEVPEREAVESVGGRVVIAGDPKDHSSSALRAKLAKEPR